MFHVIVGYTKVAIGYRNVTSHVFVSFTEMLQYVLRSITYNNMYTHVIVGYKSVTCYCIMYIGTCFFSK